MVRISSFLLLLLRNYHGKLHCVLAGHFIVAQSAFSPVSIRIVRRTQYGARVYHMFYFHAVHKEPFS